MSAKVTKEDFEKRWIKRSDITKETYDKYYVTLPCNCGDDSCKGWAAVSNEPAAIDVHNELYGIILG